MSARVVSAIFAITMTLFAQAINAQRDDERGYHKIAISQAAETKWTHAQIEGVVEYVKKEADGDVHFRVGDGAGAFVVCEVVPYRPMRAVRKGDRVRVFGITRYDKTHRWPELHPVEDIQILAPKTLSRGLSDSPILVTIRQDPQGKNTY